MTLYRRYKWRLARCTAAALAAASVATEIRVIQLHQARKWLGAVALQHHLHQLVLQAPCRIVGDAQLTMQLHRLNAFLGLGEQVNRLKPHRKRQFGGLEDGASGDRNLTMTSVALSQLSGLQMTAFAMSAIRAFEAVPPTPLVERIKAL